MSLTSRKNESVAWKVFVKVGGNKVVCRICGKQMNYQSGSSTSNMMKHLQAVHKQILADSPSPLRHMKPSPETDEQTKAPAPVAVPAPAPASQVAQVAAVTDPWLKIQQAPADLRQRWQDLKQGLHKEMRQHQQAVAWSAIGAPCLGAAAGADLLTDSQPCPQWSGSSTEQSAEWRIQEGDVTCQLSEPFSSGIKAEPIDTDDVESCPPSCVSPCPIPLVVSSPSPPLSHSLPKTPEPGKKSKSAASQTVPVPEDELCSAVEAELRLAGLRRAHQRAEEIHQEQLRESRARADAAQAERDHRIQLIRHAEELHQQQLEHSKQLHEVTMKQARQAGHAGLAGHAGHTDDDEHDCSERMSS